MTCMKSDSQKSIIPNIIVGGALLLLGILLLLPAVGIHTLDVSWRWWPVILIAVGVGQFAGAENSRKRGEAVWTMFIGSWLLVSFLHAWGLTFGTSWPILLVGIGIRMIWKSLVQRERAPFNQEIHDAI